MRPRAVTILLPRDIMTVKTVPPCRILVELMWAARLRCPSFGLADGEGFVLARMATAPWALDGRGAKRRLVVVEPVLRFYTGQRWH